MTSPFFKIMSKRSKRQKKKIQKRIERNKYSFQENLSLLSRLVDKANYRFQEIESIGITSYAMETVKNLGYEYGFSMKDVYTKNDAIELTYVLTDFLNSKGSTVQGAILENAEISFQDYKGAFGEKYFNRENKFKSYDISRIDDEVAKRAFTTYRKISTQKENLIQTSYGSENLILAIYDAEIRGLDSLMYGEDLLNQAEENRVELEDMMRRDRANTKVLTPKFIDNIGGFKF